MFFLTESLNKPDEKITKQSVKYGSHQMRSQLICRPQWGEIMSSSAF